MSKIMYKGTNYGRDDRVRQTLTPTNSTAYDFYGGLYVERWDSVGIGHLHVGLKFTSNTTVQVGTIPPAFRPIKHTTTNGTAWAATGVGSILSKMASLQVISSTGSITVTPNDGYALIDLWYPIV